MNVEKGFGMQWLVACFKLLLLHAAGGKLRHSGWPVTWPRFKLGTSQM